MNAMFNIKHVKGHIQTVPCETFEHEGFKFAIHDSGNPEVLIVSHYYSGLSVLDVSAGPLAIAMSRLLISDMLNDPEKKAKISWADKHARINP